MANFEIDRYGRIIRDSVPVNNQSPVNRPSRPYTPAARYNPEMPSVVFYLITIGISALITWLLAAFVGVHIFNSSKGGISGFFGTIGPYLIFLGGIAGSLWYNATHSYSYDLKEIILSIVSGIVGCAIFGVGALILSIVIQIIIVIVIILIVISFFGGG